MHYQYPTNPPKTGGQGPILSSDELSFLKVDMEAKLKQSKGKQLIYEMTKLKVSHHMAYGKN